MMQFTTYVLKEGGVGILKTIGRELGLVPKHHHKRKAKAKPRATGRRRMPPRKKNGEFKKR